MKRSIKILNLILFAAVLAVSSCTKENTTDPSPDNRTKFIGNWGVQESYQKGYYEVTITADPNATDRVLISNFGGVGSGNKATAYLTGSSITLDANQNVAGWILNGAGTIIGTTTMNWTYTMDNGATTISATAVFTKK